MIVPHDSSKFFNYKLFYFFFGVRTFMQLDIPLIQLAVAISPNFVLQCVLCTQLTHMVKNRRLIDGDYEALNGRRHITYSERGSNGGVIIVIPHCNDLLGRS